MPQTIPVSTNYSLLEVLNRLKRKDNVEGILLLGSTGAEDFKPYSDYDIAIVVKELPVSLFSIFTKIDSKIADVYFFTTKEVHELINKRELDAETMQGKLVFWLLKGKIELDRSGNLEKLKNLYTENDLTILSSKKYSAWFGINFNFSQNQRYFDSGDETYLLALDIRLLYSTADVISGYFTLRKLPWRGEKAAIKWLTVNDQNFLDLFKKFTTESDRKVRFNNYSEMVKIALSVSEGVWKQDVTGVTLKDSFSDEAVSMGLQFWESLVGKSETIEKK